MSTYTQYELLSKSNRIKPQEERKKTTRQCKFQIHKQPAKETETRAHFIFFFLNRTHERTMTCSKEIVREAAII